MMINEISRKNLQIQKRNISQSLNIFEDYLSERNVVLSQSEENLYAFILKKALLFKYVLINSKDKVKRDIYTQLISDYINIIKFSVMIENRALFLTIRSLIENYIRLVRNTNLSEDHITLNVMEAFRDEFQENKVLSKDDYSLIRNMYKEASTEIHADILSNRNNDDVNMSMYINSVMQKKYDFHTNFKNLNKVLNVLQRVINLLQNCYVYSFKPDLANAFYREYSVLGYLTNKNVMDEIRKFIND